VAGDDEVRAQIAAQFADRTPREDVWGALAWVTDTERYLNLGYSPRGVPTLLGANQRRLVDRVGATLADRLPATGDVRLLDVGCGRGGPAVRLAERYGVRPVGVDLVTDNVARARANAVGVDASFLVGDASVLPIRDGSVTAATAIDASSASGPSSSRNAMNCPKVPPRVSIGRWNT
jgi:SAM-dependent methyltransferase